MQLDKTQIAVRERDLLEILDLALHVTRAYLKPLLLAMVVGAAPLILINHLLIGWMADLEYRDENPFRYFWTMSILVFMEAPLASVLATNYLGQAVFLERPRLRTVARDVLKLLPRILWCQLVWRGVTLTLLVVLLMPRRRDVDPTVEVLLLPALAIFAIVLRSVRPFMNEIVLLERNPLRAKSKTTMTVARRNRLLHAPSSGDLFLRWVGTAFFGILLTLGTFGLFRFCYGVVWSNWSRGIVPDRFTLEVLIPLSMWLTAGFLTVVRFLGYLDTRIRQEGWEVELTMRAEAARLTSKLT